MNYDNRRMVRLNVPVEHLMGNVDLSTLVKDWADDQFVSCCFLLSDSGDEPLSPDVDTLKETFVKYVTSKDNWECKLLQALTLVQDFKTLMAFDLNKFDADLNYPRFVDKQLVSVEKQVLHYICESMNGEEVATFIKKMKDFGYDDHSGGPSPYLETYFSKWFLKRDMPDFASIFKALGSVGKTELVSNHPFRMYRSSEPKQDCDSYPIIDKERVGLAILINQIMFESRNHDNRLSSLLDAELLERTLAKFNISSILKSNLKGNQIIGTIEKSVQQEFHLHHSLLFVVIMSHGYEDVVLGVDGIPINIYRIQESFAELEILHGKPIVFIIVACQGTNLPRCISFDSGSIPNQIISETDDIFMCKATIRGCCNMRHILKGSLYVRALCDSIEKYSTEEFSSILVRTSKRIKQMTKEECGSFSMVTSIPEFTNRCSKFLYIAGPPNA